MNKTHIKRICLFLVLILGLILTVRNIGDIGALENTSQETAQDDASIDVPEEEKAAEEQKPEQTPPATETPPAEEETENNEETLTIKVETTSQPMPPQELPPAYAEKRSVLYVHSKFHGFTGKVIYTVTDANGKIESQGEATKTGDILLEISNEKYQKITCEMQGGNVAQTRQDFYYAEGMFTKGAYRLVVEYFYTQQCEHHNVNSVRTEPTYTHNGLLKDVCVDCGNVLNIQTVDKLVCNHQNTTSKTVISASEYNTGLDIISCVDCGKVIQEKETDKIAHVHNFETKQINSTCVQNGAIINVCKTCGESEIKETLEKSAHSWNDGVVIKDATCETEGKKEYTCTVCGAKKDEVLSKVKHNYVKIGTTEATCKDWGSEDYQCTMCKRIYGEIIEETGHDYTGSYVTTKEATCKETGVKTLYCKTCNEVLKETTIPTKPHTLEWIVAKEATYTENGLKQYKCKVCNHVDKEEVIDKKEPEQCTHQYMHTCEIVKEATCASAGEKRYICSNCNECTQTISVKPNNKHTHFTEKITKQATYLAEGIKQFTCDGCGYSYTETIPKLECSHTRKNQKYNTVTQKHYYECADCKIKIGEEFDEEIVCSHSGYSRIQKYITKPTATQDGAVGYFCENCDKELGSRTTVHAYQEYTIDLGNGQTTTVYGYFNDAKAQEMFTLVNQYRQQNGVSDLAYMSTIQNAVNTRSYEIAHTFDHYRPNGTKYTTLNTSYIHGENIARGGFKEATSVFGAWKNSAGHNENMLRSSFKSISIGCFVQYRFRTNSLVPDETYCWVQNFSYR